MHCRKIRTSDASQFTASASSFHIFCRIMSLIYPGYLFVQNIFFTFMHVLCSYLVYFSTHLFFRPYCYNSNFKIVDEIIF